MLNGLREWIVALAAAAFIGGVAGTLAPEGKMRGVVNLVCGFVVIAVMLSPVRQFSADDYAKFISEFRFESSEYQAEFENSDGSDVKSLIESKTAAYILDKTGITARVAARETAGSEYPLPWEAELDAQYDAQASRIIEAELGIPKERQKWKTQ